MRAVGQRRMAMVALLLSFAGLLVLVAGLRSLSRSNDTNLLDACATQRESAALAGVVFARHDLYPGVTITPEDLEVRQVEASTLPKDAVSSQGDLVGRVCGERILTGEPVRWERIAGQGSGRGLAALIPSGWRAQAVQIDQAPGGGGFVFPGDRIDIYATTSHGGEAKTFALLEDVRVVAVNGSMSHRGEQDSAPSRRVAAREGRQPAVTVLVRPGDALRLTHAGQLGSLQFALRSDADRGATAQPALVDIRALLGLPEVSAPEQRPSESKPPSILLIRGDQVTTEVLPEEAGATL